MKGAGHNSIHRLYTLGPPVVEQLALEAADAERMVACYFPTRAAQRCLSILTNHRDSLAGEFFWVAGAPGCGKTHFLNYFLALLRQLCDGSGSNGRELVLALDYAELVAAVNVENDILGALAAALGGGRRSPPLWRTMGTIAALQVALHETGRAGVRAITIVIDLGSNESPRFFSDLVQIAKSSKRPKLTVIAAGAGSAPPDRTMLEVEAADADERVVAAVGRARQLDPRGAATVGLYSQIKIDPFVQQEIFPFHPAALRALDRLAQPAGKVGSIARLMRAALASAQQEDKERLIYPCDLFDVPEIRRIVEQRIAGEGRAALKSARSACLGIGPASRTLAEQIVHTLALDFLCGPAPALLIDELCTRLPSASHQGSAALAGSDDDEPTSILRQLAACSKGVIQLSAVGAAFVPVKNSSPDVEAFNRALPLIKLFDPAIDSAQEIPEFNAKLAQLRQSLSSSIQEAHTVLETLREFAASCGRQLEPEREAVISDFLELAGSSSRKLIEMGADQDVAQAARTTVGAYEELTAAAASVPRLIAMREYLEDTRLDIETIEPQVTGHLRDLALSAGCLKLNSERRRRFPGPATRWKRALRNSNGTMSSSTAPRMSSVDPRWRKPRRLRERSIAISRRWRGSIRSPRWEEGRAPNSRLRRNGSRAKSRRVTSPGSFPLRPPPDAPNAATCWELRPLCRPWLFCSKRSTGRYMKSSGGCRAAQSRA